MKFFTRIAVLLYVTFTLFFGVSTLLFVFDVIKLKTVVTFFALVLSIIQSDHYLKIDTGILAALLLLVNLMFYRMFSVGVYKEKIIAFDNPAGRVIISVVAIEDLVKRILVRMREVKEIKTGITVSKKGLRVIIKLVLRCEVNIPEMTSTIQDAVKTKIQDMIGLDEPVNVEIHIGKILMDPSRDLYPSEKKEAKEKQLPTVPFEGYRA